MPQELMPGQFLGGSTTLDIDTETDTEESLELLAQLLRLLQARCTIGGDKVESLQRLFVEVRWLALDHLDGHDTQRPNIDLGTILFLLDDFRRHPVGCTDHGGTFGAIVGQLGTETEIGNLDVAARGEENVVGLDISVDDLLAVEVDETLASLSKLLA